MTRQKNNIDSYFIRVPFKSQVPKKVLKYGTRQPTKGTPIGWEPGMKGILKRRIFRETLEHTPFGSFKERNHETIHSRNRYRNLKGMPTSTTEQGTGFRSSHGCCTRLLNSSDKGRSARRSPASSFPRGSIYATIMELGPKRPSP